MNRLSDQLAKLPFFQKIDGDYTAFILTKSREYMLDNYEASYDKSLEGFCRDVFFLRHAFGRYISVYQPSKPVADLISETDIDYVPHKCPRLLDNAFLIESKKGFLFDDISGIAGYKTQEGYMLIFEKGDVLNSKFFSMAFAPKWDGRKMDTFDTTNIDENILQKTVKYLTILSLLLESNNTPLEIVRDKKQSAKTKKQTIQTNSNSEWAYNNIYVSKKYEQQKREFENSLKDRDTSGLSYSSIKVRGFIRRQACGKNWSDYKYIYISPYVAVRLTKNKHRKMTIL